MIMRLHFKAFGVGRWWSDLGEFTHRLAIIQLSRLDAS